MKTFLLVEYVLIGLIILGACRASLPPDMSPIELKSMQKKKN